MSGISTRNNVKIQELMSLNITNPVENKPKKTGVIESLQISLSTEKLRISETKKGHSLAELRFDEKPASNLPSVRIKEDGDFTFSYNAFNRNINAHKEGNSTTYNALSKDGFSIILAQNNDKRDVLVFSNMSNKVPTNSSIPNVYFYIDGKGKSKMSFDENHNIVIEMKNKEKLVIDGKDGQTILSGPFKANFNPNSASAKDFKINYTGTDHLQKFNSLGDKIKW